MKTLSICTIALIGLLILRTVAATAADQTDPAPAPLKDEFSKQENIYRSQGDAVPEGYTVDRTLALYSDALHPEFSRSLAAMGPQERWLDIGAGSGRAVLDYLAPDYEPPRPYGTPAVGGKAQVVAISIEDRRTPLWQSTAARLPDRQLKYLTGKRLRDYTLAELGRFRIITDVIGGFSYSADLSLFMQKALDFLDLNGSFYTVLQDVHSESGGNAPYYKDAPYLTEIRNADGSEVKVCSWLKSISCVEVSCEFKTGWKPPIETFHIRKVCDEVKVPALIPVHFQAGTPPERRFLLAR
jgi:hypothetical protein